MESGQIKRTHFTSQFQLHYTVLFMQNVSNRKTCFHERKTNDQSPRLYLHGRTYNNNENIFSMSGSSL